MARRGMGIGTVLGLVAGSLLATGARAADPPPWDGRDRYEEKKVEGWTVLVHKDLLGGEHAALGRDVLKLLGEQLHAIVRVAPGPAVDKLRQVPIWVERAHPKHPCMCYHPSAGWLKAHGMNPEKEKAVEVANARNFLAWNRDQPWMVLHELAHAYHDRVLGWDHAEVRACYEAAVAGKAYEKVLKINGSRGRHYALTDAKEYFAEGTEAYFGTNDFYPFVRAELKEHDPRLYGVLGKVWGASR